MFQDGIEGDVKGVGELRYWLRRISQLYCGRTLQRAHTARLYG